MKTKDIIKKLKEVWRASNYKGDARFSAQVVGEYYVVSIVGCAQDNDMPVLAKIFACLNTILQKSNVEFSIDRPFDVTQGHGFFIAGFHVAIDDKTVFRNQSYSVGYAGKRLGLSPEQVEKLRDLTVKFLTANASEVV